MQTVIKPHIMNARLVVGLLQGVLLYFLFDAQYAYLWQSTNGYLIIPLKLVSLFIPVILVSSLGHLQKKDITIWLIAALVILSVLGLYDVWRSSPILTEKLESRWLAFLPSMALLLSIVIGFYCAHSLVLAGTFDRRYIARYSTYFDVAWKLFIQIKFSLFFVGVLWLILCLGAELFALLHLNFFKEVIKKLWFSMPVSTFAFSWALHITDVRPSIVQGIRTLLLALLSWILPVVTCIVLAFLLSLPWTGLSPLWETRYATSSLLAAAIVLILLINTVIQDGENISSTNILRVSVRVAALLLLPLTSIAVYALSLRVTDYGWTIDRVVAAAYLFITSCYALGYAWAICHRNAEGFTRMARVNVVNVFVIIGMLLALSLPIADPARLSVNNQMNRLLTGKVSAQKFDFDYLKYEGMKYGLTALARLKTTAQSGVDAALIKEKVERTLQGNQREFAVQHKEINIAANIRMWPKTAHLPTSFLQQKWVIAESNLPSCLTQEKQVCDAYLIDLNSDDQQGILLIGEQYGMGAVLFMQDKQRKWSITSYLDNDLAGCQSLRKELQAGNFRMITSRVRDIEIAGQRIPILNNPRTQICIDK